MEKIISIENEASLANPSAPVIIYKTSNDYSAYVPVIMNEERTKIVSYPAPIDLFFEGTLAYPIKLKNGYLLDNRGINEHVVYLNYTFEAYSVLKDAPSHSEMMLNILDKFPLTELYQCGFRSSYNDLKIDLNGLIDNNFKGCKKAEIIPMSIMLEK